MVRRVGRAKVFLGKWIGGWVTFYLSTELVVRGVDRLPHQLVQGLEAGQDDRSVVDLLDGALSQTHQVSTNAHRTTDDELFCFVFFGGGVCVCI